MSQLSTTDEIAGDASTKVLIVAWIAVAIAAYALDHRVLARVTGTPLGLATAVAWAGLNGAFWAYHRRSRRAGWVAALLTVVLGLALAWLQRRLRGA